MPKLHILTLVLETQEKGREIKRGKTGREVFSFGLKENWKGGKIGFREKIYGPNMNIISILHTQQEHRNF